MWPSRDSLLFAAGAQKRTLVQLSPRESVTDPLPHCAHRMRFREIGLREAGDDEPSLAESILSCFMLSQERAH